MAKRSITLRQTDSLRDEFDRLHEFIGRRAYEIFLSRDPNSGSDLDDWLLAEQELVLRPAIELSQRNGHIELNGAVTDSDPIDLAVRVGPQDILITSTNGASRDLRDGGIRERTLVGSVHLPTPIDPNTVEAEWRNGLLHLTAALARDSPNGAGMPGAGA